MDVVKKFYDAKYHPTDLYATIESEKIYFHAEAINKLYDLPNDIEYPGHGIITKPTRGITKEVLKTITWPSAE